MVCEPREAGAVEEASLVERLRVLFAVAAEVQAAPDDDAVLRAAGRGLNQVGIQAHLDLLDDSGRLILRHAAFLPQEIVAKVERRLGRPLEGTALNLAATPYDRAVRQGEVVWVPSAGAWLARAVPWIDHTTLRLLARLPAVGQGVCAPIQDGTTVLGTISAWGATLTEADVPTVALLGRHTGTALARLRTRRQEQAAARFSGAMLVARTVAHQINNALAPIAGFAELLSLRPEVARDPTLATYAQMIQQSAKEMGEDVARLQRIVRLEEDVTPLGPERPLLDVERSTSPDI